MDLKKRLDRFFFANYLLMLLSVASFTLFMSQPDTGSLLFSAAAVAGYSFVYLIPAGLLLSLTNLVTGRLRIADALPVKGLIYATAVSALTLTHLVILADRVIYKMYGFHFNGFVWNLLTTQGGIESMGFDRAAYWTTAAIFLGAVTFEIFVLIACIRWERIKNATLRKVFHTSRIATPYLAVCLFAIQGIFFGISSFSGNSAVLTASANFPFYVPITFQQMLTNLGLEPQRNTALASGLPENLTLHYPLEPLRQRPNSPRYNIVWLVAESWRADTLNEEIMPQTWRFAQRSQHFVNHYSGGNGTRKGLFSMFYGLYGNYWSEFLNEQRPPVLMDLLQKNGYQIDLYTSARFTYPEFDKTIFSHIPAAHLHEQPDSVGWKSDRINVTQMLDFIDARDNTKPFMTFLFFESPHARYYFPPECEIKSDFLKEFNYATVDVEKDIDLIFNRYINSCNHLDTQFARVINYLEKKDLLETTLVIITGDHGEEFMEHGRWGHNSAFVEEQVRMPLVIRVPGMQSADYPNMTSHLDIPATVMNLLGVENPPADYSLGMDLFSEQTRTFTVFADWSNLVYRDRDCKIVLPLKMSASFSAAEEVTTADDQLFKDPDAVYRQKMTRLIQVLKDSSIFTMSHSR